MNQLNPAQRNAIGALKNKMAAIPEADYITNAMIVDWVDNSNPDEVEQMPIQDWKDLINETWRDKIRDEQGNIPNNEIEIPFGENDYDRMLDFYKEFVIAYYAPEEGNAPMDGGRSRRGKQRRKRHSKTKKAKRKGRSHKKTRKHK